MDIEKVVKGFFALLVFVFISHVCSGCIGCMPNYSDGERTGTVVKLSHKGFLVKSWEGSLHLGQSQITGGNDTWEFSLEDKDGTMAQQLMDAQHSGKVVTLHYHQWAMQPYSIETQYEVDSIDVAK